MLSRWASQRAVFFLAVAAPALAQQTNFTFNYVLATTQNAVPLQPGGTIAFPPTTLNSVAQAVLNITNTSAGARIDNISSSGAAFTLQGLPAFPDLVGSQQTLQVLIRYQPSGSSTDTGQIQITFDSGAQVAFGLQGTLSAAKLVYQVTQSGQTATVAAGGTIAMPATSVGSTSTATITVQNAGNLSATINSIILTGQNFQISNTPALPEILAPSASFTFKLTFAPTQAATDQAALAVGTDSFTLTGQGLGANLVFSYKAAGTTVTLGATDSVVFAPVTITQTGRVTFVITNNGTVTDNIFNIGIVEPNSPFSVSGLPALPVNVAPNGQSSFTLSFTPTTEGFVGGTLRVGNTTIGLIGSGTPPPALPAYTLTGPTGSVSAMTQPSVGLTLASPYPAAIAGTLTLSTSGDLPSDPAVQFSTGGRTVAFVIAANTTGAVFAGQGPQIQLQTGTVASAFTLTPSFATQAGDVSLTPNSPSTLQFAVAPAAPTIISLQAGSITANGFVLTAVGYSTTRSLSTLAVQFTAGAGFQVATGPVNIDLTHVAAAWFASTASDAFGGQFTVTVPFTLSGTVATGQTLTGSIASVSATLSNSLGTSSALQTAF
jgi:hypothetical protein